MHISKQRIYCRNVVEIQMVLVTILFYLSSLRPQKKLCRKRSFFWMVINGDYCDDNDDNDDNDDILITTM